MSQCIYQFPVFANKLGGRRGVWGHEDGELVGYINIQSALSGVLPQHLFIVFNCTLFVF